MVLPVCGRKRSAGGWRLRKVAEQAATITVHEHPLPLTEMGFLELMQGDEVAYQFDGTGSYYCRLCLRLRYGAAHHCAVCVPSYDVCEVCFAQQKAVDIGNRVIRGVNFEEDTAVEYHSDSSGSAEDPFCHFGTKPTQPSSLTVLQETKRHDFVRLLEVLFPKQSQEDLAAEAQGIEGLKLDYSIRDNDTGRTMLHFACEAGNDKVVLGLLMHIGTETKNKPDYQGLTPLMVASIRGKAAVVEELLYGSADTSLKCKRGYTALMLSVCYNWADITSRLLFSGASVNEVIPATGRSALSLAALNGATACAQRLLQCDGIDRDVRDHEGYTPLLLAASKGFQDIIELFPEEDRAKLHW